MQRIAFFSKKFRKFATQFIFFAYDRTYRVYVSSREMERLENYKSCDWHSLLWQVISLAQPDIVELTMMMESLMDDVTMARITTIGQKRLLALNAACVDGYVRIGSH